ncbi:MAG: hypothetical protein PHC43_00355 [Candidatus Marinimicrobia bacterium]|nr:hypothetical protein [Candidatus Neomarinimicrobiota bacterium]
MITQEQHRWAIITAQEPKIEVAFVVCMKCNREASTLSGGRSDEELKQYFESEGWTVLPTKCPKCKEQLSH